MSNHQFFAMNNEFGPYIQYDQYGNPYMLNNPYIIPSSPYMLPSQAPPPSTSRCYCPMMSRWEVHECVPQAVLRSFGLTPAPPVVVVREKEERTSSFDLPTSMPERVSDRAIRSRPSYSKIQRYVEGLQDALYRFQISVLCSDSD